MGIIDPGTAPNHRHPQPNRHRHASMGRTGARRRRVRRRQSPSSGRSWTAMPSMKVAMTVASPIAPGPTIEQVAIEHGEVRRLADLDRPGHGLEMVGPGGTRVKAASASSRSIRSSGRNGGGSPAMLLADAVQGRGRQPAPSRPSRRHLVVRRRGVASRDDVGPPPPCRLHGPARRQHRRPRPRWRRIDRRRPRDGRQPFVDPRSAGRARCRAGGGDPHLPEPPSPRSHDQLCAVPECGDRRLLGPLPRRPVARPRWRRLPTLTRGASSG